MMPPQWGMLTIGAFPMTLPLRITSMIFLSVLNCFRKASRRAAESFVWRLRVRDAAEAVRAVAVDAAVGDVEGCARDGRALSLRHRRGGCGRDGRQPGTDVRDEIVHLLSEMTAPQTGM